jgi:hypothetical protein
MNGWTPDARHSVGWGSAGRDALAVSACRPCYAPGNDETTRGAADGGVGGAWALCPCWGGAARTAPQAAESRLIRAPRPLTPEELSNAAYLPSLQKNGAFPILLSIVLGLFLLVDFIAAGPTVYRQLTNAPRKATVRYKVFSGLKMAQMSQTLTINHEKPFASSNLLRSCGVIPYLLWRVIYIATPRWLNIEIW